MPILGRQRCGIAFRVVIIARGCVAFVTVMTVAGVLRRDGLVSSGCLRFGFAAMRQELAQAHARRHEQR